MNIFCNNINESEATIADFLGKNIWVRCRILRSHRYGGISDYTAYVRFIRSEYSHVYDCNVLPESDIEHCSYNGVDELGSASVPIDEISIISPLETKTTEELFGEDITAHNTEIFKRFENKPYWIHVTSECLSEWWGSYYIQIARLDGMVVGGKLYKDYYVDLYESAVTQDDVDYDDYPSDMYEYFSEPVDTFRIQEPLDLLSDTEIREILNDNDYLYESMRAENNAEDEDEE